MITKLLSTRLVSLSLASVLCAACGSGPPAPSGQYTLDIAGTSLTLEFKDMNNVVYSYAEAGESESKDCTYQLKGDDLTMKCPEGNPMTLVYRDGALELKTNDATFKFTKK